MESKCLNWGLLGFFTFWFAIVVPGHQRGAIALPGEQSIYDDSGGNTGGCPLCTMGLREKPTSQDEKLNDKPEDQKKKPKDPVKRCAICYIVGMLDVPLQIYFELPEAWLICDAWKWEYQCFQPCLKRKLHLGRAPPLCD